MKLSGFNETSPLSYPSFTEAWRFSQLESYFPEDLKASKPKLSKKAHLEISGNSSSLKDLPGVTIETLETKGSDFWSTLTRSGQKFKITISQSLSKPLNIAIQRDAQDSTEATLSYLEIHVKGGVKAQIIQEFHGTNQGHTHTETKLFLGSEAQVEHALTFKEGKESISTHFISTELMQKARYEQTLLTSDVQKSRINLLTELKGSESFAKLRSLSLLKEKSQVDLFSQIIHHSADTSADQLAKNLIDGESKAIFTGKIKIVKDAQRVHSAQLNRNILKSKKAHAIGQPQLEIFADDVKCSHGSTTGRIGENELFYLLSRGISQKRAQELLSHAFIHEVFTETSEESKAHFLAFLENL